jgi:hypothetical protein
MAGEEECGPAEAVGLEPQGVDREENDRRCAEHQILLDNAHRQSSLRWAEGDVSKAEEGLALELLLM